MPALVYPYSLSGNSSGSPSSSPSDTPSGSSFGDLSDTPSGIEHGSKRRVTGHQKQIDTKSVIRSRTALPIEASAKISVKGSEKHEFVFDVPGSKSHSIRALLLASLTTQTIFLQNVLDSQDTQSMYAFLDARGVKYDRYKTSHGCVKIYGQGRSPVYTSHFVDLMNSGTSLFFASAVLGFSSQAMTLTGDTSLRRRTSKPLLDALRERGATVVERSPREGCPPYTVSGTVSAGDIRVVCPTSQYLSALLLVLSFTQGTSTIHAQLSGEYPYVEMTLQWLMRFGAKIKHRDLQQFTIQGIARDPRLQGISYHTKDHTKTHSQDVEGLSADNPIHIMGDYSSAAFLFALAPVLQYQCLIRGISKKDVQADSAFLAVLNAMGCILQWNQEENEVRIIPPQLCPESIEGVVSTADTAKEFPKKLVGGDFDLSDFPDSLPILAVVACFATSPTRIYNVGHARIKETDRISVMHQELTKMGAQIAMSDDGLIITPHKSKIPYGLQSAELNSYGDHRVAMSLTIAALGAQAGINTQYSVIREHEVASITFPDFYTQLNKQLGKCVYTDM